MAPMSKKQLSKLGLAALAVISIAERRRKQRNLAHFLMSFLIILTRCCEMLSDLPNRGMLVVPLSIRFGCQNVEDWGSSPHLNQLRLTLVVAPICHFCAVFLGSRDVTSREKSART